MRVNRPLFFDYVVLYDREKPAHEVHQIRGLPGSLSLLGANRELQGFVVLPSRLGCQRGVTSGKPGEKRLLIIEMPCAEISGAAEGIQIDRAPLDGLGEAVQLGFNLPMFVDEGLNGESHESSGSIVSGEACGDAKARFRGPPYLPIQPPSTVKIVPFT